MTEISRLPGPVMDLWEWQYEGKCREADPTLFFHPEGERGSARRRRAEAASSDAAPPAAGVIFHEDNRQGALF